MRVAEGVYDFGNVCVCLKLFVCAVLRNCYCDVRYTT